jgi:hypothetical protein
MALALHKKKQDYHLVSPCRTHPYKGRGPNCTRRARFCYEDPLTPTPGVKLYAASDSLGQRTPEEVGLKR